MLIQCPSGLSFDARGWIIKDRRNLKDAKTVQNNLVMRRMLEAACLGVSSPGPYPFKPGDPIDWGRVCLTDFIDALIGIRVGQGSTVLSYDDSCKQCKAAIPLDVDLTELKRTPISPEGLEHLNTGEPLQVQLPGKTIEPNQNGVGVDISVSASIRILCGNDAPQLAKYMKQEPTLMEEIQLAMHIVELRVPGEKDPRVNIRQIMDFYEMQPWSFQEALEDQVDKFGGGADTRVGMVCPQCGSEQTGALPFGMEFYYPIRRQRKQSLALG